MPLKLLLRGRFCLPGLHVDESSGRIRVRKMWVRLIIVTHIIVVAFSGYPSLGRSTHRKLPRNGRRTDKLTSPEVYIVWPKSTQHQLSDGRRHTPPTRLSWKSRNIHSTQDKDNANCPYLEDFLNNFCPDQNDSLDRDILSNAEKHVQRNILLRLQPGEHALSVSKRFICYDNLTIEGSSAASTVISATDTGVDHWRHKRYGVITFEKCGKVLIKDLTFQLGRTNFYNSGFAVFIYDFHCRNFELLSCIFINQTPNLGSVGVSTCSSSATISDCQFHRLADRPFGLYGHNEPSLTVTLGSANKVKNNADISHKVAITGSAFVVHFSASACTNTTSEDRHRQM